MHCPPPPITLPASPESCWGVWPPGEPGADWEPDSLPLPSTERVDHPAHPQQERGAVTAGERLRVECVPPPTSETQGNQGEHCGRGWLHCGRGSYTQSLPEAPPPSVGLLRNFSVPNPEGEVEAQPGGPGPGLAESVAWGPQRQDTLHTGRPARPRLSESSWCPGGSCPASPGPHCRRGPRPAAGSAVGSLPSPTLQGQGWAWALPLPSRPLPR